MAEAKVCANRYCEKDGKKQPIDNFHRNVTKKGGRANRCKACVRLEYKAWYNKPKSVEQ